MVSGHTVFACHSLYVGGGTDSDFFVVTVYMTVVYL